MYRKFLPWPGSFSLRHLSGKDNDKRLYYNTISLCVPELAVSEVSTLISKTRKTDHRHSNNQTQKKTTNNKNQTQGEKKNDSWSWGHVMSEALRARQMIASRDPKASPDYLKSDDYLEMLASLDLKPWTYCSVKLAAETIFHFVYHDGKCDVIDLGHDRSIEATYLCSGSLNEVHYRVGGETVDSNARTFVISLHGGLQKSFNGIILGRLVVKVIRTLWIVVLDEEKHLWALRASKVDEDEISTDEFYEPHWPPPRFDNQNDVFGTDLPVVKLGSVASVQRLLYSGQQLSPEPCDGAESWTSGHALAKPPADMLSQESYLLNRFFY